ncbi:hypothetical protein PFISCL1PPCAC_18741, partial [Pristionchus fissidentatus]
QSYHTVSAPEVDLSSLINLSDNMRSVSLHNLRCVSLTAFDLRKIREVMLNQKCQLAHLKLCIDEDINISFLKNCFGVTIRETENPYSTVYLSTYSVELHESAYTRENAIEFSHYDGKLETKFSTTMNSRKSK